MSDQILGFLNEFGDKIQGIFSAITEMSFLHDTLPMLIMWVIGGVLIFLAIKKEMEPTLLLPMGFQQRSYQDL